MVDSIAQLPDSLELDISAFSRLFDETTNSYKFVFFLSLLDILRRRQFTSGPIHFREIIVEMLANSWFPHTYFKLSFGLQDKITTQLDSLKLEIVEPILKFTDSDKRLLRATIGEQLLNDSLMRYAPFRLLRPFFEVELKGVKDYEFNRKITQLAKKFSEERRPLYWIDLESKYILPHKTWVMYLQRNYSIIRGWASWQWLEYMQRRNQNVPAVSAKLFPPQERAPLIEQASYWKSVFKHESLECIYSGAILSGTKISLDHYLPWSFVAHDHLWNLVPTLPEVNSAKSNNLPANSYFDKFVSLQHRGLVISQIHLSEQRWERYVEPFVSDLKFVNKRDLLVLEKLRDAYQLTLRPLLELAKNLGFAPNWQYSKEKR